MSIPLKLISLNIERSRHLDRIVPFLQKQQPDVVCLHELYESDVPLFEHALGMQSAYAILGPYFSDVSDRGVMTGSGIYARSILSRAVHYYAGSAESAQTDSPKECATNHPLLSCDIEHDGASFRVITTHFTWSPRGEATDEQRRNMANMLKLLEQFDAFVLTGDFNAPRGGEIFSALSSRYKDNIPPHYKTSLDATLHYAGKKRPNELADKMVDGLFTTPAYVASDVELVFGFSDHAAIVGNITRT